MTTPWDARFLHAATVGLVVLTLLGTTLTTVIVSAVAIASGSPLASLARNGTADANDTSTPALTRPLPPDLDPVLAQITRARRAAILLHRGETGAALAALAPADRPGPDALLRERILDHVGWTFGMAAAEWSPTPVIAEIQARRLARSEGIYGMVRVARGGLLEKIPGAGAPSDTAARAIEAENVDRRELIAAYRRWLAANGRRVSEEEIGEGLRADQERYMEWVGREIANAIAEDFWRNATITPAR